MKSRAKSWGLMAGLSIVIIMAAVWVTKRNAPADIGPASLAPTTDVATKASQSHASRNPHHADEPKNSVSPKPANAGAGDVAQPLQGATTPALFGENLRKLLNSDRLKNTDYVAMRLIILCPGTLTLSASRANLLTQRMADEKKAGSAARFVIGAASYERRLSATTRFDQLCSKILNGAPLQDSEYAAHNAKPEMDRWRAIAQAAKPATIDLDNPQTKRALETVVATPLYGVLESILYTKLDYSALASAYPDFGATSLSNFVVPILLCRMGDDCGSDGFLTLQLCENNGICGNDVENAIWTHLESRQVNTAALREFIDQRQRALTLLDFSILKNTKSKN
jgi:hypothetical protein